ncbi:hypothetical protein QYF36_027523 [Acer negundo]|nr:hypothetical protein QYF36_027523 [Acer negundo]
MTYEQALNGCLEASALRFSRLEAPLRRIEVHFGAIMKAMQGKASQEFPSPPMLEEANTIPWNSENEKHNYIHNIANDSSSISGEEVGEKEKNDEMKDSMPYVPPTIFPSRLLKSNWSKYFF